MFFSDDDTIFLAQVKAIIPATKSFDREKIWPFIEQAERKYVFSLLEQELYDDLQKFVNEPTSWSGGSGEDTTRTTELIRLIRIAELNLANLIGYDLLNTVNSAAGFQKPGDSEGFKGLYKYQEENLKKYFETTGYNGLDDMLKYIEDYIEYFPQWENSTYCTLRKTAIIKDAATFNSICYIAGSRLTFLRLQIFMDEVIDFDIKPLLGDEYDNLMAELSSESPEIRYTSLLPFIRKPLAFLACAKLIEKTGNLTDRGFFFEGKSAISPDDTYKNPAMGEAAWTMAKSYRDTGERYLKALAQYLIDNSFTDTGSTAGGPYNRDNTGKKTFVA